MSSPKSIVSTIDLDDPNILVDSGHIDIVDEEEKHNLAQPMEEEEEEEKFDQFEDKLEEEDKVSFLTLMMTCMIDLSILFFINFLYA